MRHDIVKMIPGFTDPKKQPQILKELRDYAISMGFGPEEMADIRDRRVLLAVWKAMQYDKEGMMADGGVMADGGKVGGPGGPRDDRVPAMLSNGEYVIPAHIVRKLGTDYFDAMLEKYPHKGAK